jgi:hypothetical protein
MSKFWWVAPLALTIAWQAPAMAQGTAADAPVAETPAKAKKVCRSEKVTGSRTKVRRVCMTQADWDDLAARTKKGLDEMARGAAGGTRSAFEGAGAAPGT